MNFKDFIEPSPAFDETKKAVYCFGHFNPPIKDHVRLWTKVYETANELDADPIVLVSNVKGRSNPLDYKEKVKFIESLAPFVTVFINENLRAFYEAASFLTEQKYSHQTFVTWCDHHSSYSAQQLTEQNKVEQVNIVTVDRIDPDLNLFSDDIYTAALCEDVPKFRALTGWHNEESIELMEAVKKGLHNA